MKLASESKDWWIFIEDAQVSIYGGGRLRFASVCSPLTRGRQRLRYGTTPAEAGFRKPRLRGVIP